MYYMKGVLNNLPDWGQYTTIKNRWQYIMTQLIKQDISGTLLITGVWGRGGIWRRRNCIYLFAPKVLHLQGVH